MLGSLRSAALLGPVVVSFVGSAVGVAHATGFKTLALSATQAPGAMPGATFIAGFGNPVANASSGCVFTAILTGTGVDFTNNWGLYAGTPSAPTSLLARTGQGLPGAPGVTLLNPLSDAAVADDGTAVFQANLTGAGVTPANDVAFCASDAGVLAVVAREGDPAPGSGLVFGTIDRFQLAPAGRVAFSCLLAGAGVDSTNDGAIFAGPIASPQLVAREGQDAIVGPGVTLQTVGTARTNGSGDAMFTATLVGTGVTSENNIALYLAPSGVPAIAARTGDPVPGAAAGTQLGGILGAWATDTGAAFAHVRLTGAPVGTGDDTAFASITVAGVSLLIREGDPAPGIAGATLTPQAPYVHHSGRCAFTAVLAGAGVSGANDTVLYIGDGASFTPVAREGDPAPGLGGALYAGFTQGARVNANGDAAFIATLSGPGVTGANNAALFLVPAGGAPAAIVRTGDAFDVDDSAGADLRTPTFLQFTVSGDAGLLRSSLDDEGRLAFSGFFADGSMGVFLASQDTPCPADLAAPPGVLNFFDIQAFIALYNAMDPAADLAAPFGVWNFFDIQGFVALFNAGCP